MGDAGLSRLAGATNAGLGPNVWERAGFSPTGMVIRSAVNTIGMTSGPGRYGGGVWPEAKRPSNRYQGSSLSNGRSTGRFSSEDL